MGAYDLTQDAGETRDEAAAGASWARELLERHAAVLQTILAPLADSEPVELEVSKAAELEALGY